MHAAALFISSFINLVRCRSRWARRLTSRLSRETEKLLCTPRDRSTRLKAALTADCRRPNQSSFRVAIKPEINSISKRQRFRDLAQFPATREERARRSALVHEEDKRLQLRGRAYCNHVARYKTGRVNQVENLKLHALLRFAGCVCGAETTSYISTLNLERRESCDIGHTFLLIFFYHPSSYSIF